MFRQASRFLSRATTLTRSCAFSTEVPVAATEDTGFIESWKKVIPNMDPLRTRLSVMIPRRQTPTSIPSKLTINFVLPTRLSSQPPRDNNNWWLLPIILLLFKTIQARFVDWHIANPEIQDLSLFCPNPDTFWMHEPS